MADGEIENQNLENNPGDTGNNPGGDGGNSAWWETAGISADVLPENLRAKYNSMDEFVKGAVNAQSMIGKGIPDENTPEDVRDAFFAKLGRPESPDKYSWSPPEGFDVEGVTSEHFKSFKELAYKSGITDKQLSDVMGGWSEIVNNLQQQHIEFINKLATDSKAALSAPNEWGDKYDEKLGKTYKKIEELGIMPQLKGTGLLYDANVLKAFHSIISGKEETRIKGADGNLVGKEERLAQIRNDPAYTNAAHPDHAARVREFNAIMDGE